MSLPLSFMVNWGDVPAVLSVSTDMCVGKIDWSNLSEVDLMAYLAQSDNLLGKIELPKEAAACSDINCKNPQHGVELCSLYENVVESSCLKQVFV